TFILEVLGLFFDQLFLEPNDLQVLRNGLGPPMDGSQRLQRQGKLKAVIKRTGIESDQSFLNRLGQPKLCLRLVAFTKPSMDIRQTCPINCQVAQNTLLVWVLLRPLLQDCDGALIMSDGLLAFADLVGDEGEAPIGLRLSEMDLGIIPVSLDQSF